MATSKLEGRILFMCHWTPIFQKVPVRFCYDIGADGSHPQLPGLWQRRRLLGSPPVLSLGHLLLRLATAIGRGRLPACACAKDNHS